MAHWKETLRPFYDPFYTTLHFRKTEITDSVVGAVWQAVQGDDGSHHAIKKIKITQCSGCVGKLLDPSIIKFLKGIELQNDTGGVCIAALGWALQLLGQRSDHQPSINRVVIALNSSLPHDKWVNLVKGIAAYKHLEKFVVYNHSDDLPDDVTMAIIESVGENKNIKSLELSKCKTSTKIWQRLADICCQQCPRVERINLSEFKLETNADADGVVYFASKLPFMKGIKCLHLEELQLLNRDQKAKIFSSFCCGLADEEERIGNMSLISLQVSVKCAGLHSSIDEDFHVTMNRLECRKLAFDPEPLWWMYGLLDVMDAESEYGNNHLSAIFYFLRSNPGMLSLPKCDREQRSKCAGISDNE